MQGAGGLMYFVSDRGSGIANLFTQKFGTEDNHVLATPQQVMAVQLRDGEKQPFMSDGGDRGLDHPSALCYQTPEARDSKGTC